MSQLAPDGRTPLFALSAAVFVERDGEILLLKRAGGEMTGAWYIPGGAVDAGETVEEAARRELFEESGLAPTGPLTCVGVSHMEAYGLESLQVLYACDCAPGDVVLSDEHSAARWMDAATYRERYFSDEILARFESTDRRIWSMLGGIRAAIDAYVAWRALRDGAPSAPAKLSAG
jgi:8-oxo-dGTP diphosphatase